MYIMDLFLYNLYAFFGGSAICILNVIENRAIMSAVQSKNQVALMYVQAGLAINDDHEYFLSHHQKNPMTNEKFLTYQIGQN